MFQILFKFMFGDTLYQTLTVFGFDTGTAWSLVLLAKIEVVLVFLYLFVSIVYFFICLLKRNRRDIL